MAPLLEITIETKALIDAIDRFPVLVLKHVREAAKASAESIARDARARVARATGETAKGIGVAETYNHDGYVVFSERPAAPGLPGWLEFGTKHMGARPYLFSSARLEESAYDRRVRQAIETAIRESGLGE